MPIEEQDCIKVKFTAQKQEHYYAANSSSNTSSLVQILCLLWIIIVILGRHQLKSKASLSKRVEGPHAFFKL